MLFDINLLPRLNYKFKHSASMSIFSQSNDSSFIMPQLHDRYSNIDTLPYQTHNSSLVMPYLHNSYIDAFQHPFSVNCIVNRLQIFYDINLIPYFQACLICTTQIPLNFSIHLLSCIDYIRIPKFYDINLIMLPLSRVNYISKISK